jgi:hypothetical protein
VQVAVAANFAGAPSLARIGEGFTAATGHVLKVSAGPTGKFYTQIVSGAPFEVLMAADDETPKKLIAEGHAVAGSNFTYAIGKLVLWSASPGFVDDQGAVLASGKVKHVAIANPKLAPYGAAAMELLKARGLATPWRPSWSRPRASRRPTSSCHRQCRARLRRAVAGGGAGQAGHGVALARAARPVWRDPPGRRAAEGGRKEPGGQGPAGLSEERRGQADHDRDFGYGL